MQEGKIMKALSGFYYVLTEDQELIRCRGRGVFRKNKITPLVGDEVVFQRENQEEGYILDIKGRKNELIRPPIANVDQAILVFSAVEPDFNTILLDRFLVLVEFNNICPIICMTKIDLATDDKKRQIESYLRDYKNADYTVIVTSSRTGEGIQQLFTLLNGKTSVFAGQSGVGKSTLLNSLKPDLKLKTNEISSHLGRGKHTTRHVELLKIGTGLVADTPGFSSLELTNLEPEDLNYCFPEIERVSENCKFRGCLHIQEPKCAVIEAVEKGDIPSYRHEHYKLFIQEILNRKPRY